MPTTFRKKSRAMHANRTRGYGTIGAHRAKGVKGGTGLTTGKFKHKWSYYQKMKSLGFPGPDGDKWRIGKKGFTRPQNLRRIQAVYPINIRDLESKIDAWVEEGKVEKTAQSYVIDLGSLKYNKLIGKGKVTKKMDITVAKASKGAVEKLKEAKCKLTLTAVSEA